MISYLADLLSSTWRTLINVPLTVWRFLKSLSSHKAVQDAECPPDVTLHPNTLFFFGYRMPFSNFHYCNYSVTLPEPYGQQEMHSVEQLYMFWKAHYFNDQNTCKKILDAPDARSTKLLGMGDKIKDFDEEAWMVPKKSVMMQCLVRKFTDSKQASELRKALYEAPACLVEASPTDLYWGIGVSKEDAPTTPRDQWKGGNMMGKLLTALRDYLRNRDEPTPEYFDEHGFHQVYEQVHSGHMFEYSSTTIQ